MSVLDATSVWRCPICDVEIIRLPSAVDWMHVVQTAGSEHLSTHHRVRFALYRLTSWKRFVIGFRR